MAKKTLLQGALIGSFGIFISKLLGLLYVVPLNSLAGDTNISFYSIAYTLYGLILNICSAGLPFAIASMVAKYVANKDYHTVLTIKRIGVSMVLAMSFLILIAFISLINPLAKQSLGVNAQAQDLIYLGNCYMLLGFAIIAVPFLSAFRGYYQGLKELKLYAQSQIVEQLIRVLSIIFLGFIVVKILHYPSIYAVYMAIIAASLGAFGALVYLYFQTKSINQNIKQLAKNSISSSKTNKELIIELWFLALPFVGASLLSSIGVLVHSNFFIPYATASNIDYETAKVVLGIYQVNVSKIISIPTVITIGYSTGLVPYLSEAYARNDFDAIKKHILEIIDSINFIMVPICFLFIFFAKAIYYVFFGSTHLDLGYHLLAHEALVIYIQTFSIIFNSILLTIKLKKQVIISLVIGITLKVLSFILLIKFIDILSLNYSSLLYYLVPLIYCMICLVRKYQISYTKSLKSLVLIFLASISMNALFVLFNKIGFIIQYEGRIQTLFVLSIYGLLGLSLYLFILDRVGIIKNIFKQDLKYFINIIYKKLKKN